MILGSVYELSQCIGEIRPGLYAVIDIGPILTLCRLWRNEDGDLSPVHHLAQITWEEMEEFEKTDLSVDLRQNAAEREEW